MEGVHGFQKIAVKIQIQMISFLNARHALKMCFSLVSTLVWQGEINEDGFMEAVAQPAQSNQIRFVSQPRCEQSDKTHLGVTV